MKIDKTKIYLKGEQGQSLIEFALILPIFLVLFSFVIDMWRVYDAEILLRAYVCDCTNYYQNIFDPDMVDDSYQKQALDAAYADACIRLDNGSLKKIVPNPSAASSVDSPIVWDANQREEVITFKNTNYKKLKNTKFTTLSRYATFTSSYDVKVVSPVSKIFAGETIPVKASYTIDVSFNVWR